MRPIERYQYLKNFWKRQIEELNAANEEANEKYNHWSNKLVEAEIAEKLAAEK